MLEVFLSISLGRQVLLKRAAKEREREERVESKKQKQLFEVHVPSPNFWVHLSWPHGRQEAKQKAKEAREAKADRFGECSPTGVSISQRHPRYAREFALHVFVP